MPYDNILPALEYIDSDKLTKDDILLDDDKIIETVQSSRDTEMIQDKEEVIPNISLNDALNSIEKLITFHNFPPESYEVTSNELKILKGIRRKILRFKSESALQLNLNEFVVFE